MHMNKDKDIADSNLETDPEITLEINNDTDEAIPDTELVEEEHQTADKIKQLREKLARCDEEKRQVLEDSQRIKADFLNAKRRLEEDRQRDLIRIKKRHIEELLPLCDSFEMAMKDKDAWEKADEAWRKGIEGINAQLMRILTDYGVLTIDPLGQSFDPYRAEAVGTEVVVSDKQHDTVVAVVQRGYEIVVDGNKEVIRPARVIIGAVQN